MKSTELVKVRFNLDPNESAGMQTESLWAESLGPSSFRIISTPFFAFNISPGDVVAAEMEDGHLTFKSVISRGGHSTYRLFLQNQRTTKSADFEAHWASIRDLGPTFENANDHFIAVDIPPSTDVNLIYQLFEVGEEEGLWIFEEAHFGANGSV